MTYFCNFLKLPVKHRLPPALTRLHHDGCAEEPTRFLVMGEAIQSVLSIKTIHDKFTCMICL